MAEYCLECFNKINKKQYKEKEVWIDYEELDICEGCGEIKPCIVNLYPKPILKRIKDAIKNKRDNG